MPLIAIDFDGVIHHQPERSGLITGETIPGAFDFIRSLMDNGIEVCIFTTRVQREYATAAIRDWMGKKGLEQVYIDRLTFPAAKPIRADMFVDDRAYHFTGENFPTVEFCREFKPWNKQ